MQPAQEALWLKLARVAAWSVLIGVALEGLILAVLGLHGMLPAWAQVAAQTVQKVSWSLIVCAALAAAQNARNLVPQTMGLVGLVFAPLALIAARALHKGTLQALGQVAPDAGMMAVMVPALLKGLEYAAFGWWTARLSRRASLVLAHFLRAGFLVGLAGAIALALWKQPDAPTLVVDSVNELFFPVGCSFVLYVSARAARAGAPE